MRLLQIVNSPWKMRQLIMESDGNPIQKPFFDGKSGGCPTASRSISQPNSPAPKQGPQPARPNIQSVFPGRLADPGVQVELH